MCPGCGLTDGEGIERIWSRIRKLIPITRNQWVRYLFIFPRAALNVPRTRGAFG
jgi:hypothetical protein